MLMNFGPINQRGGEKRLNVIFSRARQHMAVVSRASATTRSPTTTTTARRRCSSFLRYAEAVSRGDARRARGAGSTPARGGAGRGRRRAGRRGRRAAGGRAARARLGVAERVGQSAFRCDLAVRRPGDDAHRVAVLVDTPARVGPASRWPNGRSPIRRCSAPSAGAWSTC